MNDNLHDLLLEVLAFLKDQEDADLQGDPPQYVPNKADAAAGG